MTCFIKDLRFSTLAFCVTPFHTANSAKQLEGKHVLPYYEEMMYEDTK
jgi:hypothetical protein